MFQHIQAYPRKEFFFYIFCNIDTLRSKHENRPTQIIQVWRPVYCTLTKKNYLCLVDVETIEDF